MAPTDKIADIRKEYKRCSLSEEDSEANPFDQFNKWWNEGIKSNIEEINAMTLATVNPAGKPSARIVLLKGASHEGFVFFSNYESRKAKELELNGNAALVFFWKEMERQIRIEGTVSKTSAAVSDEYFMSRPRESRIGAISSPQSTVIRSRKMLEDTIAETEKKYEGKEIPRPGYWGGFILKPETIEFWQGRPGRLHDRIEYFREKEAWGKRRLAP